MARRRGRRRSRPLLFVIPKVVVFLAAIALGLYALSLMKRTPEPVVVVGVLEGEIIHIDPGHGGIDPGACGARVEEKDIVLKVALYLGVRLEKHGAQVVYSRSGDYDLYGDGKDDAEERVNITKTSGATMMISLHCDDYPGDPSVWGAQTFYNDSMNPESERLAMLIQEELIENTGTPREASADLDHFMLRYSEVPAVTVEMGFLSNAKEEARLASSSHQRKIADCILRAIISFVSGPV